MLETILEKDGCEIHLKCFHEANLIPPSTNCIKGGKHVNTSKGIVPTPTSNRLGRGVDWSFWPLLLPIRTSDDLIGI